MPNPKKILSICTSDTHGGAAKAAYRIHCAVNELAATKHLPLRSEMFVLNKGSNDPSVRSLSDFLPEGKWFTIFDYVAGKIKNKLQHLSWYPYKHTQDKNYKSDLRGRYLYGALEKLQPDIVHLHWISQRFINLKELHDYVMQEEKKGHHISIVWTLHDSWPFCGMCHYFLDCTNYQQQCGNCPQLRPNVNERFATDLSHKVWQKKANRYKDLDIHVVSPSQWLADCAKQSSLLKERDIQVIPNCLDTTVFCPSERESASEQEKRFEKPILLYGAVAAATDRIKGFSNLLSALQIIEKQYNERNEEVPFELVVFGADQSNLPIETSIPIRYMGYVSNTNQLVDLYHRASVMVVPSLTENLSCAIMEALACGTPVCCFDIGGNGDMVTHKKNGYLAKELDNADLAKGILWLLEHNKDNALGNAARKSVVEQFTPEVVARQYVKVYDSI